MGYDSVKHHRGRPYTGMRVGGRHAWRYEGTWRETKTSPQVWSLSFEGQEFSYEAGKMRARPAPSCSGAEVGRTYHWLIVGSQFATKASEDKYDTFLMGQKWLIGVQRPEGAWSYERPGSPGAKERVVRALDELLVRVRGREAPPSVMGEGFAAVRPARFQQARLVA